MQQIKTKLKRITWMDIALVIPAIGAIIYSL